MKKFIAYLICIFLLISSTTIVNAASYKVLSVSSTSIKNKQENIKPDSIIKITFNKKIKQGSNYKKITLTSADKKRIDLTISLNNNDLIIKPKTNLQYSTSYILNIPGNSIIDEVKKPYTKAIAITFKTAGKPEKTEEQKMQDILKNFSVNVTPDSGKRIENGQIPYVIRLNDGKIRMYYVSRGDILSAVSNDGLNFSQEEGIRIQNAVNPTVIKTSDGKYRAYYNRITIDPDTGWQIHKIYSAISDDGLNFEEEGLCFEPSDDYASYASVPEAVITPEGNTRLYYITDNKTGKLEDKKTSGVGSSISTDGKIFKRELGNRINAEDFCDPSLIKLPNGYNIMFNDHNQPVGEYSALGLYASISKDGINFSKPLLVIPDNKVHRITDPCVFKISDDTYRVYYWCLGDKDMSVLSATIKVEPKVIEGK